MILKIIKYFSDIFKQNVYCRHNILYRLSRLNQIYLAVKKSIRMKIISFLRNVCERSHLFACIAITDLKYYFFLRTFFSFFIYRFRRVYDVIIASPKFCCKSEHLSNIFRNIFVNLVNLTAYTGK